MLDGRVKTLHPKIHGGILARRDLPAHVDALAEHAIRRRSTWSSSTSTRSSRRSRSRACTLDEAIENIDIGGPAMVRAAAKNYGARRRRRRPGRLPGDRRRARAPGSRATRRASRSRARPSRTPPPTTAPIANWLTARTQDGAAEALPQSFRYAGERVQSLRYGENPHQAAAFYRDEAPAPGAIATFRAAARARSSPTTTSLDLDAALGIARSPSPRRPASSSSTPIPAASRPADSTLEAYRRAFATRPDSAPSAASSRSTARSTAPRSRRSPAQFVEVHHRPGVRPRTRSRSLAQKKNVRVLEIALPAGAPAAPQLDFRASAAACSCRRADARNVGRDDLQRGDAPRADRRRSSRTCCSPGASRST